MLKLLIAIGFFEDPENLEAWERRGDSICIMSQEYSEQAVLASDEVFLDGVPDEEMLEFVPVYKYCIMDDSQPPSSEIAKK
tara:strand:- start:135 stop:377 length:243 start_codon:yes stop_codon:yes gene_type:complete